MAGLHYSPRLRGVRGVVSIFIDEILKSNLRVNNESGVFILIWQGKKDGAQEITAYLTDSPDFDKTKKPSIDIITLTKSISYLLKMVSFGKKVLFSKFQH